MPFINLTVPKDIKDGVRLDKFVSEHPEGLNRSRLKTSATEILVNSKTAKLSAKVKAGDIIQIQWEDAVPQDIIPQDIPLSIIYEDEHVTVVNKEQSMVTHPACGNWEGTLVNALLFHWGRQALKTVESEDMAQVLSERRPGIVHRLDKDTSGIIITAKDPDTQTWLSDQFLQKRCRKEYIVIVQGRPPAGAGDIVTQIVRDPHDRKKFKAVIDTDAGKYARTLYKVIACYGKYSLIRVRLKTGRTHQIRVHMKYIGCPVLGDPIYAKPDPVFKDATLMLHSRQLCICLPGKQEWTMFRAAVPKRFKDVISTLKQMFPKEEMKMPGKYQ